MSRRRRVRKGQTYKAGPADLRFSQQNSRPVTVRKMTEEEWENRKRREQ